MIDGVMCELCYTRTGMFARTVMLVIDLRLFNMHICMQWMRSTEGSSSQCYVQAQRRNLQISILGHTIFSKSIHCSTSILHASRHNASISTELAGDNLVEVWHASCKTDRTPPCQQDQQSSSYRHHHLSDYWKTGSPGTQHAPDSIVFDKR